MLSRKLIPCLLMIIFLSVIVSCAVSGKNEQSEIVMLATMIANPEYIRECKETFPAAGKGQVYFLKISPGLTTKEEVERELGAPLKRSIQEVEWQYNAYNIYFTGNIVDVVLVYDSNLMKAAFAKFLEDYGCPDLVYAFDKSEDHPSGHYTMTRFIYLKAGVEFAFQNYPIRLTDDPINIEYFKPQSLEEYLVHSGYDNYSLDAAKTVSWGDAVR